MSLLLGTLAIIFPFLVPIITCPTILLLRFSTTPLLNYYVAIAITKLIMSHSNSLPLGKKKQLMCATTSLSTIVADKKVLKQNPSCRIIVASTNLHSYGQKFSEMQY